MESRSIRRIRPLAGSFRYYPYIKRTFSCQEDMKEEVVRLGVELSLYVAQSMFLLCDDIPTMLGFCFKLWRGVIPYQNPVIDKLLRVIHYVYSKDIKPKNGVYQDYGNSVQWELIRTTWTYFADGIIILQRLDTLLRRKVFSFNYPQISSAIEKYKQEVLKKLEDILRSAKDVSEVNGFAKETIESNIFDLWKSLFDEEATSNVARRRILTQLFKPVLVKPLRRRNHILVLPVNPTPYILSKDFARDEVKEEVLRLGVELSLYVAESMFLLCDDIRTMLWFCFRLRREAKRGVRNEKHVVDRLVRVMHHVYTNYIKPKNGVYQNDGNNSVQWGLIWTTLENFANGFSFLNLAVYSVKGGSRVFVPSVEKEVKKVEDKLGCVKSVSEANGFVRDVMETNILDIWKSLYDEEAKEATLTLKLIKSRIFRDLFLPVYHEVAPH